MKKIFSLLFVLIQLTIFAQYPPMGAAGKFEMKGHVLGKVVDEKGVPVQMTTVLVLTQKFDSTLNRMRNVVLKTVTNENNGEFLIEDLSVSPMGKYVLKVANFGYITQEIPFTFQMDQGSLSKDFGKVVLKPETAEDLSEVKITAIQSTMTLDVDKKTFNVGQSALNDGGTAIEVMKNIPGLDVDIEGNVKMRNAAPTIFIDGRPTVLTLDQIPAESIESVELITNPSAKYDASGGGAGIINIILKKNKKSGYNGAIRAGMDSYLGANLGGDVNIRQNKWNISLSLNGRKHSGTTFGDVERTNLLNGEAQNKMIQDNLDKRNGLGFFGKFGVDYLMTNRTTLSLSTNLWSGSHNNIGTSDIFTDSVLTNSPTAFYSYRNTNSKRSMVNYGINLGMKHLFERKGEEWTFDATFNNGNYKTNSIYQSDFHLTDINSEISRQQFQKIEGNGGNSNLVLQTDYVLPTSIFKIETGLRAALRQNTNNNENYLQANSIYQLIYNPASKYSYNDNVYAAYVSLSNQYKSFGYKVGLRAESSEYKGKLLNTGEKFGNQYPISLFPSVFLTQKLKSDQDLQLSYTRRVNRPGFMELIPFVDSVDVFNMQRGNPNLRPEFTSSFELQYMKRFKNRNTVLASAYYKYTDNLITRYLEKAPNGALINTYINANSSYQVGFEATSQNYIGKWLEINFNVNVYNSKINSDDPTQTFNDAMWSWFSKLNLNFKLPKSFTLQVSGLYQSKSNVPASGTRGGMSWMQMAQTSSQGYVKDFFAIDLALRKPFLNNRLITTLSVSDVLGSRINETYTESTFYTQDFSRLSNPFMVRLNVSWSFGKIDTLLFKRLSKGTGESIAQ